jgi:hypothetical protein
MDSAMNSLDPFTGAWRLNHQESLTVEEYCSSQNLFASRRLLHRPAITVRIAEEDE